MDRAIVSKFSSMMIVEAEHCEMTNKENRKRRLHRRSKSTSDLPKREEKKLGESRGSENKNKQSNESEKEHIKCDYVPVHRPGHHYPTYLHSRECCDSPDQKHMHQFTPRNKKLSAFQMWQKRYRKQKEITSKRRP